MDEPNGADADATEAAPDPAAWLDAHGDALYRYALSRVRTPPVAEDLVQDTLLAAIRGLDGYAHTSSERTWLIGILRHKMLDHFRRMARDQALWDDDAPIDEPDGDFDERGRWRTPPTAWSAPESALDQEQFWHAFDGCVEHLPEKLRTPFVLRELDGLDTGHLTEILRVTKSNLWTILSRARQQLRRCLQHHWFQA